MFSVALEHIVSRKWPFEQVSTPLDTPLYRYGIEHS